MGASWVSDTVVNSTSVGNRFFPWICATGGRAFVSWYDRRDASSANADLTAYYRASVLDTGNSLAVRDEANVSGVNDPECMQGFPSNVSAPVEEQACADLPGSPSNPITVAQCCTGTSPCTPLTPAVFCDPRFPNCPSGSTCSAGRGSQPEFGNYDGNACASGQLFMIWASTTPPLDIQCTAIGRACRLPNECCQGSTCIAGVCAPPTTGGGTSCKPSLGAACANSSSCCSAVCRQGQCACLSNGAACSSSANCCSGTCQAGQCMQAVEVYTNSATMCHGSVCEQDQACTGAGCCDGPQACGQACCAAPIPYCAGGTCCSQPACGNAGCCDPGVCVHTSSGPTCCSKEAACGDQCCSTPGSCMFAVPLLGPTCGCQAPDTLCTNVSPDGTKTTECCENDSEVHYTCMTFEPTADGTGGGNHCCDEAHACGSVCCPFQDTCVAGADGNLTCQSPSGIQ